jgi:glycosyltransferase involved in cell wall biosynthesis
MVEGPTMSSESPMTILILVATERVSGPLKGVLQCWQHLDRSRYQPVLGLLRARRDEPCDAELEARRRGVACEVLEQSGAFDLSLLPRARRLAAKHGAVLVQTHGYKTHVLGLFLKRSLGLRWIGFEHGWTAESWRVRLYHRLDWLLRYADRAVAVSDDLCRVLRGLGVRESRLLRVHNAVGGDEGWSACPPGLFRQAHGIPLGVPLVTVIGRIAREKGQGLFVQAFESVRSRLPQARAAIIGEGVDEQPLRAMVRERGLDHAVHLVAWQQQLAAVYVDTDVITLPSLSEGIPNVMLEAMAAGCPVVATTVGGVTEVAVSEEHALLVPPADPDAMARAIVRLLQDKPLRDRLVEAARRRMETHHSPSRRAARIAELYESLLEGVVLRTRAC